MRRRLSRAFDRFVDLAGLSHAGAAQAIHADAVDILVDLKGYTQHARTEIMALRPAPVQASYLGYPGTMGAGFIDYLIADRVVIAPGSEEAYSERIVFLPGSYQVNDRKRPLAQTPSRAACGLPEEAVVFCCFNQSYKILPETFATWMRLLRAVPRSVLWLLEANPWAVRNLRREARARGVDPARLIFAPRLPLDRHLARLPLADLVLDTRPYNAHTTASDALWTGVPVVTCPGDTFASRVAASLLVAAGLPELVAATLEDYEALAVRLARAPEERAALRRHLTESRCSMPLFDTPAFTRHLERAYEEMWRKHLAGTKPRPPD
jgi:predicted O-linked N-acetylglucosamine transferase (SPINDLY family)